MFCKWCGMESAATDLCSWCHRPLSAATKETSPPAEATPTQRAPLVQPLSEEEGEEESPLAAGITPERSARQPAAGHRPAWAPVPRGGAAAVTPSTATAEPAFPSAASTTDSEATSAPAASRPVIGVRRPGGAPAPGASVPGAGIGVRRSGNAPAPPMASPRPSAPNTSLPASGVGNRPAAPMPVPIGVRNAATAGAAPAVSRDPFVRHPAPQEKVGTDSPDQAPAMLTSASGTNASPAAPVNRVATTPRPLVTEEAESGGLADGIAAGKRPVERQTGIPSLGTFTPANSKYYTGQVLDPISGNHYDSVTGQSTSAAVAPVNNEIVLHWDDPVSTPLHFGRFGLAFAGLLIGMTLLTHILPDYAALPLVIVMFAAGILMPVMRAVPFQSDDSDDLVWFVLLTLLFGPAIGLLIYSAKAFMLRDMNIAVLGLLAVSFLGYLAFQLGTPLPPVSSEVHEGFFNILKLAPPWSQAGRYGYSALLYNWAGLIAMLGWFVGNVFHKLDE